MAEIRNLSLRRVPSGWEFSVVRNDNFQPVTTTDTEQIKQQIEDLLAFADTVKTEEQKRAQEADEKLNLALLVVTVNTTDEEKIAMMAIYPEYQNGVEYSRDMAVPYVRYKDKLYQVIAAEPFTSQESWTPDIAVSLFKPINPPGTIAEWKQPTGAHDAYKIGDRVVFQGWVWCSIINGNTWSPAAYPQGWEKEYEV